LAYWEDVSKNFEKPDFYKGTRYAVVDSVLVNGERKSILNHLEYDKMNLRQRQLLYGAKLEWTLRDIKRTKRWWQSDLKDATGDEKVGIEAFLKRLEIIEVRIEVQYQTYRLKIFNPVPSRVVAFRVVQPSLTSTASTTSTTPTETLSLPTTETTSTAPPPTVEKKDGGNNSNIQSVRTSYRRFSRWRFRGSSRFAGRR
tara:strand:+ start:3370 stop:3966 length:597 start_codon:yes stop_codon:yes gene_type:complete